VAKYTAGSGAGAVVFVYSRFQQQAKQIVILFHAANLREEIKGV
jgi:hypothetical protein